MTTVDIDRIRGIARDAAVRQGVNREDADAMAEMFAAFMDALAPELVAMEQERADDLRRRGRDEQAWERLTRRVAEAERGEQHWRAQYRDVLTRLEERTAQKEAVEAQLAQLREANANLRADVAEEIADRYLRRTPEEWLRRLHPGLRVLDPDGWRGRDGIGWDQPITRGEFEERLSRSTVQGPVARRAYPCAVCAQLLPVPGPTDHDCKPIVVKQGGEDRTFAAQPKTVHPDPQGGA